MVLLLVLANDTDPDGDALTAVLINNTTQGTLTLNANGPLVMFMEVLTFLQTVLAIVQMTQT